MFVPTPSKLWHCACHLLIHQDWSSHFLCSNPFSAFCHLWSSEFKLIKLIFVCDPMEHCRSDLILFLHLQRIQLELVSNHLAEIQWVSCSVSCWSVWRVLLDLESYSSCWKAQDLEIWDAQFFQLCFWLPNFSVGTAIHLSIGTLLVVHSHADSTTKKPWAKASRGQAHFHHFRDILKVKGRWQFKEEEELRRGLTYLDYWWGFEGDFLEVGDFIFFSIHYTVLESYKSLIRSWVVSFFITWMPHF